MVERKTTARVNLSLYAEQIEVLDCLAEEIASQDGGVPNRSLAARRIIQEYAEMRRVADAVLAADR